MIRERKSRERTDHSRRKGQAGRDAHRERFADLHCHTTASHDEINWPYRLRIRPLMTPLEVYNKAKERGMHFVTFTDHDTIDGALELERVLGKLPDDFFISEEVTAGHPDLPHEIHVNVLGITPEQHAEIQALPRIRAQEGDGALGHRDRIDVRRLVEHLRERGIIYVWNHPVWNEDCRRFERGTLQALSPLFPLIEVRNGTRRPHLSAIAQRIARREGKGVVAGSDSHSDEVGLTYTSARASTKEEFLAALSRGKGRACGQSGTAERFVRDAVLICREHLRRLSAASTSTFKRWTYLAGSYVLPKIIPYFVSRYHTAQDESIKDVLAENEAR